MRRSLNLRPTKCIRLSQRNDLIPTHCGPRKRGDSRALLGLQYRCSPINLDDCRPEQQRRTTGSLHQEPQRHCAWRRHRTRRSATPQGCVGDNSGKLISLHRYPCRRPAGDIAEHQPVAYMRIQSVQVPESLPVGKFQGVRFLPRSGRIKLGPSKAP
jgi:hypothetical protein